MEEEELKIETHSIFWAKWLHNTYENISKDQNWETQKECQVEFNKLPSRNKAVMLRIGSRLEIRFRMMKDKGFLAGQLAERERCLKMIEEMKEAYPNRIEWNVCLNNLKELIENSKVISINGDLLKEELRNYKIEKYINKRRLVK
jgi:hypothetical protein